MDRYKMLPSYHYVENEDGVINNPATDKVRTCTIYGNHGKNLIPFPYVGKAGTQNGVTITVDSDGVITLNGTATAGMYFGLLSPVNSSEITKPGKYTISGMPGAVSGISIQCYVDGSWGSKYNDYGNGSTFTVTSSIKYVTIQINSGVVCDNVVIKPMLEEGETKTDFELWCGVGDETKNLIPYPYADTTKTINGVTFTDNGDGTITANGTATGVGASFLVFSNSNGLVGQGKYYLSGCPSNNDSAVSLQPKIDNEWNPINYDFGKGQTITVQSTLTQISCVISSGKTVDSVTFRPFLAKADSATSYEPYGYKIPVANDTRENLLNVEDCTATQTNSYYAGKSIILTDSSISTYLPYLNEIKGKKVVYSCNLDNENFIKEFLIFYNVEVDGPRKYMSFDKSNQFTVTLPDETPIRLEFRARSGSADLDGTTVKFSNISLKLADVDPDTTNIYTLKQIMQGEIATFNEPFKLSKANQLSVETAVKPSAVKYTYYTY